LLSLQVFPDLHTQVLIFVDRYQESVLPMQES